MPCDQCQAVSRDGDRCQRQASCHQGCYEFCWQHAKMYREGRAEGEWQKGKGCTGKKLYQYRKKSGPKTGSCNSKTMIGVSGNCVARTPANLARKKEALASRKLKGKKAPAKKKKAPRDSYPFEKNGGSYDPEEAIAEMMGMFTCPEGQDWNDDTGECECPAGHRFDKELKKGIKARDFERIGFPEAETIEEVMEEIGGPPEPPAARKRGSRIDPLDCPEGEYWSEKRKACRKNKAPLVIDEEEEEVGLLEFPELMNF